MSTYWNQSPHISLVVGCQVTLLIHYNNPIDNVNEKDNSLQLNTKNFIALVLIIYPNMVLLIPHQSSFLYTENWTLTLDSTLV